MANVQATYKDWYIHWMYDLEEMKVIIQAVNRGNSSDPIITEMEIKRDNFRHPKPPTVGMIMAKARQKIEEREAENEEK